MADENGPIVRVEAVSKTFGEVLALDSVSLVGIALVFAPLAVRIYRRSVG